MEGIGYNVLRMKEGIIDLKGIMFGRRNESGFVETFSDEVIDEVYCQYLGVDETIDYQAFIYKLNKGLAFHIGVPKELLPEKPVWRDIMRAERFVMTMLIDDKPQVFNEEGLIVAFNLINTIKKENI